MNRKKSIDITKIQLQFCELCYSTEINYNSEQNFNKSETCDYIWCHKLVNERKHEQRICFLFNNLITKSFLFLFFLHFLVYDYNQTVLELNISLSFQNILCTRESTNKKRKSQSAIGRKRIKIEVTTKRRIMSMNARYTS